MKRILLALGAALVLFAMPSFGQECGNTFGYNVTYCSNSEGCSMQYVWSPELGERVIWNHYQINCCGQVVTAWVNTGAFCFGAGLTAKQKSSMELLLSEGIHLMTKDCVGRPVVFTSPAAVAQNSPPIDLSSHDKLYLKDLLMEQKQ